MKSSRAVSKSAVMIVDKAPPDYGGAGAQAVLLAQGLGSSGYQIRVVARRRQRTHPRKQGIVTFLGPGFLGDGLLSNILFALQVFFVIMVGRERVVHIHGAYYYGFTAALAAKLRRRRIILKVTLLGKDDAKSVRKTRKFGLPVGRLLVLQFIWADAVIALNGAIRDACVETAKLHTVVVLPNAVDEKALRERVDPNARKQVVFSGAVSIRKGVDTLLVAWSNVSPLHPDWSLVLAGPVRDDVREMVESAVRERQRNVRYLGELSQSQSWDALGSSRIFVLPSLAEGLSNSLIEAMFMGLRCVVSDIEVNRQVCGDAALYSLPGNPKSLASAISSSIKVVESMDPKIYEANTRAYSMSRLVVDYLRIYESDLTHE